MFRRLLVPIVWLVVGLVPAFGAEALQDYIPDLAVPSAGVEPVGAVPYAVIQQVAVLRAEAVWRKVASGPVIPYQDHEGRTIAYMFHFRVDGNSFPPDYEQAVRESREDILQFEATAGGRVVPPTGRFRYGHVLVSARYDRAPLLTYGEGLSEFYSTGWQAREAAAAKLGTPVPELSRVLFVWPTTFFEFTGNGQTVVLHANLLTRSYSGADFVAQCRSSIAASEQEMAARLAQRGRTMAEYTAELKQKSAREWELARQGPAGLDGQAFVPGYDQAPFYDWSFGCTPTSGAMIFGWLDNYRHYGRLVDLYYQRWDRIQGENDYHVPNCQYELAVQMGTDTISTGKTLYENISPGLIAVGARFNSYGFGSNVCDNYTVGDYCWAEAVAAIENGHPFIWSFWRESDSFAHSMAVFGYDNDAIMYWLHNTWDPPGQWWHYSDDGNATYVQIDEPYMTEPQPSNYVHLYAPHGDQRYSQDGQGEVWHVWSSQSAHSGYVDADSIRAYFSTDGGSGTWTYVATSTYLWPSWIVQPWMTSDRARVRVELYKSYVGWVVAGDGSYGNFRVVNTAPPAPTIQFPPNNVSIPAKLPVKPKLIVSRISYAQEYNFAFHNDSMGDFTSGWIPDTAWREPAVLPIGSSGSWSCQARNPTGISPTSTATYKVIAPGGFVHKRYPPALTKKKPKKGASTAHKKKKKRQGNMLSEEDEILFMMPGNNTRDFVQYSAWYDTWTVRCSLPPGPSNKKVKAGGCLVTDEDFAYAFKGGRTNEFWRYDPARDGWDSLPWPIFSKGMKAGFAVTVYEDSQWVIYAGSGASNNEWGRYLVGEARWAPADPPTLPVERAKTGSSLTWDGDNTLYFLPGGTKENEFYSLRLDQSPRTWTKLGGLPLAGPTGRSKKVREGGCIEFLHSNVYAVKGGNTKEFWSYSPATLAWTYLGEVGSGTALPPLKGIKCGRALTASDQGIFIMIGNNTEGFYFYPVTPDRLVSGGFGVMAGFVAVAGIDLAIANPVRRPARLRYSLPGPGPATFSVYDATGRMVARRRTAGRSGILDLRDLSAGVYLLRIEAGGRVGNRKLVIE